MKEDRKEEKLISDTETNQLIAMEESCDTRFDGQCHWHDGTQTHLEGDLGMSVTDFLNYVS